MAEKKLNFFDKIVEIIQMWNNPNFDTKIDFIKTSISDTQNTIRAIDIKVEIILGILVLVMTGLFTNLPYSNYFYFVLVIMILLFLSVVSIFITLRAINNPMEDICMKDTFKNISGIFYGAKYISGKQVDCDRLIKDTYSKSEKDLLEELLFDFSKLIYIRNRKLKWQELSFIFAILTVIAYVVFLLIQINSNFS
jgi:F0F1-type ATP synthase assembly protein I